MSIRQNVRSAKRPSAKCPFGKMSFGKMSFGKVSFGKLSGHLNHCGFPSLNPLIKTLNYIILIVLPSSSHLWPQDHSLQEIQDL
jgi:hypothetical protein